jgi:serine beta-lactamase-like protein LACTB
LKILRITGFGVLVILLLAGAGFCTIYVAQEPIPELGSATVGESQVYDESFDRPIELASEALDGYRESLIAPSLSVAVAVGGQLVWADARGYADIETREPASLETVYPIGSVSKPITAALASLLWEKGVVDIDADIHDYLPTYPQTTYPITLRQLLSHQAGIRHYAFALIPPLFSEFGLNKPFATTEDSLALFAEDPLLFEPDTDFAYSTYGYTLVSAVIEKASGKPYLSVLQEELLDPLEMKKTAADRADEIPAGRSSDYSVILSNDAVIPSPEIDSSYKWAGGGLVSTPSDLVRFGSALLDDRLLNTSTREVMFSAREVSNGELNPQHYGLGWRIGGLKIANEVTDEEEIITLINHGGSSIGSISALLIAPDYRLVVAMAANTSGENGSGPMVSAAAAIARHFIRYESDQAD